MFERMTKFGMTLVMRNMTDGRRMKRMLEMMAGRER
jgi:hypothetical protein